MHIFRPSLFKARLRLHFAVYCILLDDVIYLHEDGH